MKSYLASDGFRYVFPSDAAAALELTEAQLRRFVTFVDDPSIVREVMAQAPRRRDRPPGHVVRAVELEGHLNLRAATTDQGSQVESSASGGLDELVDLVATLRAARALSNDYQELQLRRLDLAAELIQLGAESERRLLDIITQFDVPGASQVNRVDRTDAQPD